MKPVSNDSALDFQSLFINQYAAEVKKLKELLTSFQFVKAQNIIYSLLQRVKDDYTD